VVQEGADEETDTYPDTCDEIDEASSESGDENEEPDLDDDQAEL
jgi:hypothetical protein